MSRGHVPGKPGTCGERVWRLCWVHTGGIDSPEFAMRFAILLPALLLLAACATATPEQMLAEGATPITRTESNGDVITEYRLAGTLKMVKVVPFRGAAYYIYDRNGDGMVNDADAKGGPMTYYKLFSW